MAGIRHAGGTASMAHNGHQCEGGKAQCGNPRRLEGPGAGRPFDAQLILEVGRQTVVRAELLGDLQRQLFVQPPPNVDGSQLMKLGPGSLGQLPFLELDVGVLRVALRAHRDILTGCHGHGSSNEACDAGDEDGLS